MALDKLVDSSQLDTDLTSVANAIRTKGGTSGQLAFPAGFVSAVQAIPTGVTPTGTKQISITANGTTTEDVTNYASVEITVNVPSAGDYVAADWLDLTKPVGRIESDVEPTQYSHYYIIRGRTKITSVFLTKATQIADSMFAYAACKYIIGPKVTTIRASSMNYNSSLLGVDLLGGTLTQSTFYNDSKLATIVLRKTTLCALSNINVFTGTPFASGKSGGTLYVPQDLIASYQAATNWSTILGYADNQILPIEGSTYETQYVDGTPIT